MPKVNTSSNEPRETEVALTTVTFEDGSQEGSNRFSFHRLILKEVRQLRVKIEERKAHRSLATISLPQ